MSTSIPDSKRVGQGVSLVVDYRGPNPGSFVRIPYHGSNLTLDTGPRMRLMRIR
jgi:hypothetical protein